jgi:hypothetical protein
LEKQIATLVHLQSTEFRLSSDGDGDHPEGQLMSLEFLTLVSFTPRFPGPWSESIPPGLAPLADKALPWEEVGLKEASG